MISYLQKVFEKNHTYNLELKDCFGVNVLVSDEIKSTFRRVYSKVLSRSGIKRLYRVKDIVFYYTKDGNLYKALKSGDLLIANVGSIIPVPCEVKHNGEDKILFVGEKTCFADGTQFDLLPAEVAEVHCGGLYTAMNNVITLPSKFDYELNQTSLDVLGTISINEKSGKVLRLISNKDHLLIICEQAIYSLKTLGETFEYQLEKLALPIFDVNEQSIVKMGDSILMVSGKKLVKLYDGKLEILNSHLNSLDFKLTNYGSQNGSMYFLPVSINGSNAIYIYDISEQAQCFFSFYGMVAENGYMVASNNAVYIISKGQSNDKKTIKSKTIDFSSDNYKALKGISLISDTTGECVINGDFGKRVFKLEQGFNKFNFNLRSKTFAFEFMSDKVDFLIKNINLKYSIKGE